MKNEYLTREATISAESLTNLLTEIGTEMVDRDCVDLRETVGIGLTAVLVRHALTHELFGDAPDETGAVTVSGADFAAKEMSVLRDVWHLASEAVQEGHQFGASLRLGGTVAALLLSVEDKLFDSDHVEEHEPVKKEETHE